MAKEEREELEEILRHTEAPSRVSKKDNIAVKVAKLTGRTISSLKAKIKAGRLDRAVERYNKNYTKMRKAMVEAKQLRIQQDNGEEVRDSKIIAKTEIALSYEKKLARLAVRVLNEDIKNARQVAKPKALRIPRVLRRVFPRITTKLDEIHEDIATKIALAKDKKQIKAGTKEFIASSLENAVYENSSEKILRDVPDAKVIDGLSLNKADQSFEERMASLRKFISRDGKKSLSEEEIGPIEKPTTNVPPITPSASVKKEEPKVSTDDLLGGLGEPVEKQTEEPKVDETDLLGGIDKKTVSEEPKVKPSDVFAGLDEEIEKAKKENPTQEVSEGSKEFVEDVKQPEIEDKVVQPTEESKARSDREKEKSDIISLGKAEEVLLRQLEKEVSPETREMIESYIERIREDILNIVKNSSTSKQEKITPSEVKEEKNISEIEQPKIDEEIASTIVEDEKKAEEPKEFKYFGPNFYEKTEESEKEEIIPIEIKEVPLDRATVVGSPSPETITLKDLEIITRGRDKALEELKVAEASTKELEQKRSEERQKMYNYYMEAKGDLVSAMEKIDKEKEMQATISKELDELVAANNEYASSSMAPKK